MKKLLLTGVSLLGLALSQTTSAITYNLNYEFSGGTSPNGPSPWVVIDITDVLGGVQIKINNSGLTSEEFNSATYLNLADVFVGTLTWSVHNKSGTFDDPTIWQGLNAYQADGDGKFDVKLEFETGGGDSKRFGSGESITFLVTSSLSGLDATDFDLTSVVGGGQGVWHAAAHIQGISGGTSGWIGDKQIVPDGGFTATLLGLGMLGLSFLARRKA